MAVESWLPINFILPDGACCGRAVHGESQWQIVDTRGGGRALIVRVELSSKWISAGLIDESELQPFSFGSETLREVSCGPSEVLAPISNCRSPQNKNEALAFAQALHDTRAIDPLSPLQDAVYVEKFGRLLPCYGITSRTVDEIVLGYWLTGGAHVSTKSFRRLHQMLSWLGSTHLRQVVQTAGIEFCGFTSTDIGHPDSAKARQRSAINIEASAQNPQPQASAHSFELPGRPELEAFFNEHVIDIVHNKTRYKALGVEFPSAIVLHGPPGCGKTFAVEQLVEYLGWPNFQIDASSIASPYIHETSKKIAETFGKAIGNAPSVLVIDEMEAFLADRETGAGASHHRIEEIAEFLRRIPEASKNEVLVVAMTNRVEMIDSAILRRGRFDHIVEVDFPGTEDVLALLQKLLSSLPKDETIDPTPLAQKLAGHPLSDVAFIVREGARLAARSGASKLNQAFLLAALQRDMSRTSQDSDRRIGFV
ncbi:MAG TPA: ATP-binding protein [Hyphomicrobiales bacterium]|nr:ATP-binding protein [Hyphomicrobiales bacterium]